MSILRANIITCDVRDCSATLDVGGARGHHARGMAAAAGWACRDSDLVAADFCPTHTALAGLPPSVDTMRVFRDPYGDLAVVWPGSDRDVIAYMADSLGDAPARGGWTELLPREPSGAGSCPNCDGRRVAAMVSTVDGTFWRCAHCLTERPT